MPETDILNPTTTWQSDIEDSMTPDYGFTRKRATTQLRKKAVGGTPWTRETQNTGHTFLFSWLQRSWLCVQRLKQYYEQYEDGFFTIIDQDGGGRHYVGRFSSEVVPTETGNGRWDVQNVTFEEIPRVAMVEYPSDWDHDSIFFGVNNDFGDQKLATSGAWSEASYAAAQITLGGILRTNLPGVIMTNPGTNAGDWAQFEYRGYGFQLYLVNGPAMGKADVYLDDVLLTTVDCYAASPGIDAGVQIAVSQPNVSLDIHRVKVVVDATKNASSTGAAISWYGLQVMR
ncbi:hypothetical protein H7849_11950 [Alloacidobacterium dinghuense]|uniref:Uncharacterized protein n=1 Tax=Alloacidobacterium dinghuense TaxID=2763107 RepID=A0A7G8BPR9_9BACT|nr:hypothetical protein [Alloacidobacterium dinghuense]QNI34539.1 hypothetical protein H7849_11950 [Alloacidobacterium dinghuense]